MALTTLSAREVRLAGLGLLAGIALGAGMLALRGLRAPAREGGPPHAEIRVVVRDGPAGGVVGADADGVWRGAYTFPVVEQAREARIRATMALDAYRREVAHGPELADQ